MKRRDFLKHSLALSTLPLLQGHLPLNLGLKNYQVFWLHMEGAPIREPFDFWADPKGEFQVETLQAGQRPFATKRGNFLLPNIWHDNPHSKWALEHWLSARGISLKGPHLKQARYEWFRLQDDPEQSIFQKFNKKFKKIGLPKADIVTLGAQTLEIYSPLLKQEISNLKFEKQPMDRLFGHWKENSKRDTPLSVAIIRGPNGDKGKLFEEYDQWNDEARVEHEVFYTGLLNNIYTLGKFLERRGKFKETAIIITSDRRKAPTDKTSTPHLGPVWEGGHFSMVSGSMTGPVTLGDIYRNHPKYKESYPLTWGSSDGLYGPIDVHQLIMDLCLAETRLRHYNPVKENPWAVPRSLQGLYIKGLPGRVI